MSLSHFLGISYSDEKLFLSHISSVAFELLGSETTKFFGILHFLLKKIWIFLYLSQDIRKYFRAICGNIYKIYSIREQLKIECGVICNFNRLNPRIQLTLWCPDSIPWRKVTHSNNFYIRSWIKLKTFRCTNFICTFRWE